MLSGAMTTKTPEDQLAVNLLDLRSEYEAELRLLTEVQRALEAFRGARTADARAQAKELLIQQLRLLSGANRSIGDALVEFAPLIQALQHPHTSRGSSH